MKAKETKNVILDFMSNKKYQWIATIAVLLIILFLSSSIRMSNWDLLTDQTTGGKILTDLDSFYFLRIAETIIANDGVLPEVDNMRYPSANVGFSQEILPRVAVYMWKIANVFGDYTLIEVGIVSAVVFFFIGLILFFILVYILTKSKMAALISSALLAFIPSYLYRTMGGYFDHDAIGIMAFFMPMIVFALGMKYISESKKKKFPIIILYGFFTALLCSLTIASWGGVAVFLFMIFPLAFLLLWLVKTRLDKNFAKDGILFYISWIIFSPLTGILFNYSASDIFNRYMLSNQGIISLFVLGFVIIDYLLIKYGDNIKSINKPYRVAYSFGITVVLGIVGMVAIGKSIISMISSVWHQIFFPFGTGRVGLTIAENSQPYLVDWISQSGKGIFWLFVLGMVVVGIEIMRNFKDKKRMFLAISLWVLMLAGALFSRISPESQLMNGVGIISQMFYAGTMFLALGFFAKFYFEEKIDISPELLLIGSWLFFTLISARSAQRIFFSATPFVCFLAGYFIIKIYNYWKEAKDETLRIFLILVLIVSIVAFGYNTYLFYNISAQQASYMGPSAHYQWQGAMSWVRENTNDRDIFIHWWDYGHWVNTLGKRPVVTDGGHAIGYWDHLIGRYLLTTPYPETAYSLMKTHNVSYLLIDPTDLGKYGAYSVIGSDEVGFDRYAAIPVMPLDSRQVVESSDKITMVYPIGGGMMSYDDITYTTQDGVKVFLPAQKTVFAGITFEINTQNNSRSVGQPNAIYYYNNKRYSVPVRYIQASSGQLADFQSGIDAVVKVIPSFDGSSINQWGSAIYLSPKVHNGLFAQLYLMNDVSGKYKDIRVAHVEDDILISQIKANGIPIGDFIYYQGFRGPIKIWEIDYPENTLAREEFLRADGGWGEFDNLEFVSK